MLTPGAPKMLEVGAFLSLTKVNQKGMIAKGLHDTTPTQGHPE